MQEKEKQTQEDIVLEKNVLDKGYIFTIPVRNIIEGAIVTLIIIYIICSINFTTYVKVFSCLVYGTGTMFVFIRGYKNRSFIQIIQDYIHALRNRKILHLRGPEYERQDVAIKEGEGDDKSILAKWFDEVKERLRGFTEQYAEEENS